MFLNAISKRMSSFSRILLKLGIILYQTQIIIYNQYLKKKRYLTIKYHELYNSYEYIHIIISYLYIYKTTEKICS